MSIKLHWLPNASASALHAAEACHRFPNRFTDTELKSHLEPFAQSLGEWIDRLAGEQASRFWTLLIGHSSSIESNQELASTVLRKAVGIGKGESAQNQLAGFVTDIEAVYKQCVPRFMEQALLRVKPLQEQWLGFGSGLTAHLGRLTDKSLLVTECPIIIVQPVLGGSGVAHIEQNLVRIEAVMTNPLVELPEVVRLTWLIAQLQLDLSTYSDGLGAIALSHIAPLAMLPAVLASAEVLELSRCTENMAELAIEQWQIPVPKTLDQENQVSALLMDWWETYLQTRPLWHTAMRALAKILRVPE